MQTTQICRRFSCWWIASFLGVFLLAGCAPSGPRALLEGERLIQQGKLDDAIEKLKLATRLLPENAQAWNHLGLAYHRASQHALALQAYQQALHRDRNLAVARFNLGSLYLELNQPATAVAEFTSYTVRITNHVQAWIKLGSAYMRLRDLNAAERSFLRGLALNPASPETLNALGVIQIHRKHPSEAWRLFHAALQQRQDFAPAVLNQAIVYHQFLQKRPLALQKYREYLALHPPPAFSNAVSEIARQLELELNPPPPAPRTNLIAALPTPQAAATPTNTSPAPSPSPATNRPTIPSAPVPAVIARSNPPSVQTSRLVAKAHVDQAPPGSSDSPKNLPLPAKTPIQSNETNPPPKKPAASAEIVQIPPEPAPKPVVDETVAPPDLRANTAPVAQTLPPPRILNEPTNKPEIVSAPAQPDTAERTTPQKKRLIDRVNPLALFRRNKNSKSTPARPETNREPTRQPFSATNEPSAKRTSALPEPSETSTVVQSTAFPRYHYQSPQPAAQPGDRAKAEALLAKGLEAHEQFRLGTAMQAYEDAIRTDPTYFEACYNLGVAAYDMKEWPQCLAAYERALALRPDSADTRFNFALALQQAKYPVDAANELAKLVARNPGETRAHFLLAHLCAEQLNQPAIARKHYRKVLELDPRHPEAVGIRYWLAAHPD